jgi:hypothetical protein
MTRRWGGTGVTPCSINHMLLGYAIWRGWSDRPNEMVRLIIVGEIRWALVSPEEAESMLIGWQAELSKESESSLRWWGGRSHWTDCLRVRICGVVILVICVHDKPWASSSELESNKSRVPRHTGWGSRFPRFGDSDELSAPGREPRRGRTFLVASSNEDEDVEGAGERQSFADLS